MAAFTLHHSYRLLPENSAAPNPLPVITQRPSLSICHTAPDRFGGLWASFTRKEPKLFDLTGSKCLHQAVDWVRGYNQVCYRTCQ